ALPVNERRHDLAGTWVGSVFEHNDVAIANVLSDHRIAAHAQGEGVPCRLESDGINRDGDTLSSFLFPVRTESGRDGTKQRNLDDHAPNCLHGILQTKRPCFSWL